MSETTQASIASGSNNLEHVEQAFLKNGFVIVDCEHLPALERIRSAMVSIAAEFLQQDEPSCPDRFLNDLHMLVDPVEINNLRLHVFSTLNEQAWFRTSYFSLAKQCIESIVGNELVMQRRINLSVQMPQDASSVLPVHADVWSGDSPYEVVLWVPFVDVRRTKSMFILNLEANERHIRKLEQNPHIDADQLMTQITPDAQWLEMKFGQVLIFTQNVLHGNILNSEDTTRWSTNCRFKSIFSPYADKKLGEFFTPLTIRPATVLGSKYKLPDLTR